MLHVLFLICYFFGFRFVFTEIPWKLATHGLSSLPQALPESPLQAKLYSCFAFFAFSVFDLMLFQCSVYFRQDALQIGPEKPLHCPKRPPTLPKVPLDATQESEEASKFSSRCLHEAPSYSHEAPKEPQAVPRSFHGAPKRLLRSSSSPPPPPGRHRQGTSRRQRPQGLFNISIYIYIYMYIYIYV